MSQISIVKLSEVEKDGRFDAEFYKGILPKNHNLEYLPISKILAFAQYGISIEMNETKGIPIYRMNEIQNMFCLDSVDKFAELSKEEIKTFTLNDKDVLFNRTNSFEFVGRTGIYRKSQKEPFVFASYLVRFIPNTKLILPEYLTTFLNTKYGISEIKRRARISINQSNVSSSELQRVEIPLINMNVQKKIAELFDDSYQKLQKSKSLYKEAEEILLKELGLENYKPKHELTFSSKLNEVLEAERFDADYFQPKYKEIEKKIEEYKGGFDILDNLVKKKKGIEVGSDEYFDDGDKPFYRVSDISINGFSESPKKISNKLYQKLKKDFEPRKGEILFTKDGTLGLTYLLTENIEGILSGAFLRLPSKTNFNKECLTLILNSVLCKSQIDKSSGGALISHLKPSEAMNLKIPLLSSQIQNKISEKIQESFKLRKESKELLEKAKKMVEDEIEKKP